MEYKIDERPWGRYQVILDDLLTKVKKITVDPGHAISYQKHFKRRENWTIISGTGMLTLDDLEFKVGPGESISINIEQKHRIRCISNDPLVFIEVQTGISFEENDIIRYKDDYNRKLIEK